MTTTGLSRHSFIRASRNFYESTCYIEAELSERVKRIILILHRGSRTLAATCEQTAPSFHFLDKTADVSPRIKLVDFMTFSAAS